MPPLQTIQRCNAARRSDRPTGRSGSMNEFRPGDAATGVEGRPEHPDHPRCAPRPATVACMRCAIGAALRRFAMRCP